MKQLVVPPERLGEDGKISLTGEDYHYLVRVRRVGQGDRIKVLLGTETGEAVVESVGPHSLILHVEYRVKNPKDSRPLFLFPGILKGSKLDDVIRQAVEAGVEGVHPFGGAHSIAKVEPQDRIKKVGRWRSIAEEAVQQSGAPLVPTVEYHPTLKDVLDFWNQRGLLIYFHQIPLAQESLHRYLSSGSGPVGLIIGPEGGLSSQELILLNQRSAVASYLGNRVLRAETASIFALGAVRIILEEGSSWKIP